MALIPKELPNFWHVVRWRELHRLLFNLILLLVGGISCTLAVGVVYVGLPSLCWEGESTFGGLLGIFCYGCVANAAYTLALRDELRRCRAFAWAQPEAMARFRKLLFLWCKLSTAPVFVSLLWVVLLQGLHYTGTVALPVCTPE